MLAFHNKPELKDEYLARVRAHAAADEIIKGQYWQNGRGCAVGCTIHSDEHKDYETLLGIPMQLALIEDDLFENLPLAKAKLWPELFLNSINVGADMSHVVSKFVVRVLGDSERGCIIHAKTPGSKAAIKSVINLYERKIKGDVVSAEEWELTRCTAYATAHVAHVAYSDTDAAFAAYAAATAANGAAVATVVYTAYAAAGYTAAARVSHYEWMSDILIEELKNASVS